MRIALSADARTLSPKGGSYNDQAREELAQKLYSATGHNVLVFRKTTAINQVVEGVEQNVSALLLIRRATQTSSSFLTVMVQSIETGEIIADTALPRGTTQENLRALSQWYVSIAQKVANLPPSSPIRLLERLGTQGDCQTVELLTRKHAFSGKEDQVRAQKVSNDCRRDPQISFPIPTVPLRVRAENAEDHVEVAMFKQAGESKLFLELQNFYRQTGELSIYCEHDCTRGKITLSLPYDPDWYRYHKKESKLGLEPYLRAARALSEYRKSLSKLITISRFPMQIVLTSPLSSLRIDVAGTASKPTLKPQSDAQPFLQSDH